MIYGVKMMFITQLNDAIIKRMLNAEMDFHLQDTPSGRIVGNSCNGHSKKKVSGSFGEIVTKRSTKLGMIDQAIL